MPRLSPALGYLCVLVVLTACSDDEPEPSGAPASPSASPPPTTTATTTPTTTPSPTTPPGPVAPAAYEDVATGLEAPWGLAFLPDGSVLVSERDSARIRQISPAGDITEVGTVAGVVANNEGGLLGVAVPPGSTTVYAYFTAAEDNRVVQMPLDGGALGDPEIVIDGIPKAGNHNGGRLAFGPDEMLYISTGDASNPGRSQDLESLGGKILRVVPDGSVPADNPFEGSPVYSYGHRNVQGLAFDDDGRLWASEFGQNTWDELNLIEAGGNYGWPEVEGEGDDERFVDPVAQWSTDESSPSGIAYVRDTIFLAALRGERLWQVPIPDGTAGTPADFAVGEFGRLRHAALAPDGSLWVLTNNTDGRGDPREGDDRILRVTLEPAG